MAARKTSLTPVVEEAAAPEKPSTTIEAIAKAPRMAAVLKGVKKGMITGGMDAMLTTIAGPIKEKILPSFRALGGPAELLEPALSLVIDFVVVLGFAEAISAFSGSIGGMMPGDKRAEFDERGQLLADVLREYIGERAGKQLLEAAALVLPLMLTHFENVSLQDLKELKAGIEVETPATEAAFA